MQRLIPDDHWKYCHFCDTWIDTDIDKRVWNGKRCPTCLRALNKSYEVKNRDIPMPLWKQCGVCGEWINTEEVPGRWHGKRCPKCSAEYNYNYNQREYQKEKERWRQFKKVYNLSKDEWLQMLADQDGLCDLCGKDMTAGDIKDIQIDHIPGTEPKVIRALLCKPCNWYVMGLVDKTPNWLLLKAMEYKDKHNGMG